MVHEPLDSCQAFTLKLASSVRLRTRTGLISAIQCSMDVIATEFDGVKIIVPKVLGDERGFFLESYNERHYAREAGITARFVQDNHSRSQKHILRGLHYQLDNAQGKLIRVVSGEVFDVVVDIRRSSPTFGKWLGVTLSAKNLRQIWVDKGFAHGFLVTSDHADFMYKTTDYYDPQDEHCILWKDPDLGIDWPLEREPIISPRDAAGTALKDAEVFP